MKESYERTSTQLIRLNGQHVTRDELHCMVQDRETKEEITFTEEADRIVAHFFENYPKIKETLDDTTT